MLFQVIHDPPLLPMELFYLHTFVQADLFDNTIIIYASDNGAQVMFTFLRHIAYSIEFVSLLS
jgi:hypothetical protein